MPGLDGRWDVERVSGILPPLRIGKSIAGNAGVTTLFGHRFARFRIEQSTLVYVALPLRDTVRPCGDGTWIGEGRALGVRYCRFRLRPVYPGRG